MTFPCAIYNLSMRHDQLQKYSKMSEMKALPIEYKLDRNDVLCGRGKKCFEHVGNQAFRQLVEDTLGQYVNAPTKMDKSFIIRQVIDCVRANATGGFVKHDLRTNRYYEVGDTVAREKTSQAFRDAVYGLFKSSSRQQIIGRTETIGRSQSFHNSLFAPVNPSNATNGRVFSQATQLHSPAVCGRRLLVSNEIWNLEQPTNKEFNVRSRTMSDPYITRNGQTPCFFDLTGSCNNEFDSEEKNTLKDASSTDSFIRNHADDSDATSPTNHSDDAQACHNNNHESLMREESDVNSFEPLPLIDQQQHLHVDNLWNHLIALSETSLLSCDDPFEPTPIPGEDQ